ncbi:MAG: hypothetical protein KDI09_22525, partial [Halioglobus sp.]|nr:hypothetical protein [Halioglobus sp.]
MLRRRHIFLPLLLSLAGVSVAEPSLYKYRGADGEWVFTDRQPSAGEDSEVRALPTGDQDGGVTLTPQTEGGRNSLIANNSLNAPVQLLLLSAGAIDKVGHEWLLPPQSRTEVQLLD